MHAPQKTPAFLDRPIPAPQRGEQQERWLVVHQIWQDVVLDTRHFAPETPEITLGASIGWHWSVLGVSMGWVPAGLHRLARWAPPLWSEVTPRLQGDFYAPDEAFAAAADHALFRWQDGHFSAHVEASWGLCAEIDGRCLDRDSLIAEGRALRVGTSLVIPITADLRLSVDIDGLTFAAAPSGRPHGVLSRSDEGPDWAYLSILTGFLGTAGLAGLLMAMAPPPPTHESFEIPDRFVELALSVPTPPEKKEVVTETPKGTEDAGKPENTDTAPKVAKSKRGGGRRDVSTSRDRDVVSHAGIMGVWDDDGLAALSGTGLSTDITGSIDAMRGPYRVQIGGGWGEREGCCGGFGAVDGTDGGLGTYGLSGTDANWGSEDGLGDRAAAPAFTEVGTVITIGGLDRALVDEVVKAHMSQIRYCYQRQLPRDPDLAGKVTIKFVIAQDGTVSSSSVKSSSLGSEEVESCVSSRFFRMTFPRPSGGIVVVSYPFLFAPG